jgi:arylformamidase
VLSEAWEKAGATTRYEAIAGTNHFTVIDPLADPQSAMTARVVELAHAIKP